MRQTHHWAADIFLGSIAVHMARVFFTGAFRKPREFNWIVGVTMLILGIVNGFLGYSLPDDLVSGTGIRIAYSIIESIPLVGSYLAFFLFGGNYPGNGMIIPRFFILHVLIVPLVLIGLARRPPRPAGQTEAHPVRRQGEDRAQRGRLADVPDLHGQDDRVPVHGHRGHLPAGGLRPDQPDLAVRPVRAVPDLLRRAARLVHGLARRRAAHHAQLGVGGLGPHHPSRGLPARGDLPRASSSTSSSSGPSSSPITPRTWPTTTFSTGPATAPSGPPPARPC